MHRHACELVHHPFPMARIWLCPDLLLHAPDTLPRARCPQREPRRREALLPNSSSSSTKELHSSLSLSHSISALPSLSFSVRRPLQRRVSLRRDSKKRDKLNPAGGGITISMTGALSSLPLETVQRIAEDARENDVQVRTAAAASQRRAERVKERETTGTGGGAREGHQSRRPSEFWRADISSLSLLRLLVVVRGRTAHGVEGELAEKMGQGPLFSADRGIQVLQVLHLRARLTLHVQAIDFERIHVHDHRTVADLLTGSHGRHVRQLQLKIALGQTALSGTCGSLDIHSLLPNAVSVPLAVQVLSAITHLTWLEITVLPPAPAAYVSILPAALQSALLKHAPDMRHFGISADDLPRPSAVSGQETPVLPLPAFQLGEAMVAGLISGMPHLTSLTLHRIGKDLNKGRTAGLARAVGGLKRLQTLNLLEVQCFDKSWAEDVASAITDTSQGPVRRQEGIRELCLVQCESLTLEVMDQLLHRHQSTLRSLCLVATPSVRRRRSRSLSLSSPTAKKYDLPSLRKLHIEAEDGIVDTVAHLERFCSTAVQKLALKYAPGIQATELEAALLGRKWKNLRKVEIGQDALRAAGKREMAELLEAARKVGVEIVEVGRSSLAPAGTAHVIQ